MNYGDFSQVTNAVRIFIMTMVLTNWVDIAGDFKRESGTNYVQQRLVVTTNTYIIETRICTNRTLYSSTMGTNGPTRWAPAPLPSLPGMMSKE